MDCWLIYVLYVLLTPQLAFISFAGGASLSINPLGDYPSSKVHWHAIHNAAHNEEKLAWQILTDNINIRVEPEAQPDSTHIFTV